ncbi:MAG: DUF4336 domain-containing protein [Myxococcota bacterium]
MERALEAVTDGVWTARDEVRLPGGVRFPLRMTIVSLPGGDLWLYSPVAIHDPLGREIDALGPVRHVVVPSTQHTLHAKSTKARWPAATLWGPEKLKDERPDLGIERVLPHGTSDAWGNQIEPLAIEGAPRLSEFEMLHKPSRSLMICDLAFHFAPSNLSTSLLLRAVGCHGKMAASRSWSWVFAKDKPAVGASVRRVLDRDFDRLIPCHGEIVAPGGRAALRKAVATLAAW